MLLTAGMATVADVTPLRRGAADGGEEDRKLRLMGLLADMPLDGVADVLASLMVRLAGERDRARRAVAGLEEENRRLREFVGWLTSVDPVGRPAGVGQITVLARRVLAETDPLRVDGGGGDGWSDDPAASPDEIHTRVRAMPSATTVTAQDGDS